MNITYPFKAWTLSFFLPVIALGHLHAADLLPERIARYEADLESLGKVYIFRNSPEYFQRMEQFNQSTLAELALLPFDSLDISDQVDYLLLTRNIKHTLQELQQSRQLYGKVAFAVPFDRQIIALQVKRRRGQSLDAELTARTLDSVLHSLRLVRKSLEKKEDLPAEQVKKIIEIIGDLKEGLKNVHIFYDGYDPAYTWRIKKPYEETDAALDGYEKELMARLKEDDQTVSPIGEEKLKELLQYEMIPYGPADLVDLANRQFTWCEIEMKKAAAEMGFGDDWKKALEKIKEHHVAPGRQPALIDSLAEAAIQFIESKDLVTIPDLAKESWRMFMLTAEEQTFAPFFLGGESILIAYPTKDMPEDVKEMSMRSNNYGFSHATVFHELIPGHNLQDFMNARYKPYRSPFSTPFSVEGWALYWEMLLWDKGFDGTPEEKVGALFWRMHRCARIIFSLNYHLGKWTPQQCIDFLVEKVGHERFSAESEVRRSFQGNYGPLYQIAYMMGGLQLRALHHELVDAGKMTDKTFHDAFLHENAIPIELFRATMLHTRLDRGFSTRWRFLDELN